MSADPNGEGEAGGEGGRGAARAVDGRYRQMVTIRRFEGRRPRPTRGARRRLPAPRSARRRSPSARWRRCAPTTTVRPHRERPRNRARRRYRRDAGNSFESHRLLEGTRQLDAPFDVAALQRLRHRRQALPLAVSLAFAAHYAARRYRRVLFGGRGVDREFHEALAGGAVEAAGAVRLREQLLRDGNVDLAQPVIEDDGQGARLRHRARSFDADDVGVHDRVAAAVGRSAAADRR